MKGRRKKGVAALRTAKKIRRSAGALLVTSVILAGGCGADLGSDPEALSVAAAEATYERDTGLLYDHASPALRAYLGDDEATFGEAAEEGLEAEGLPEGGIDASGAQQASVLFAPEGLSFYDVPATDPEGTDVTVTVGLSGDE